MIRKKANLYQIYAGPSVKRQQSYASTYSYGCPAKFYPELKFTSSHFQHGIWELKFFDML